MSLGEGRLPKPLAIETQKVDWQWVGRPYTVLPPVPEADRAEEAIACQVHLSSEGRSALPLSVTSKLTRIIRGIVRAGQLKVICVTLSCMGDWGVAAPE